MSLDLRMPSWSSREELDAIRNELSVKSRNALLYAGCATLEDAAKLSEGQILSIPGVGRKSLNEIKERLWERGLKLAPHPDEDREVTLARLLGRVHATKAAYEKAQRDLAEPLARP